MMTCRMTAPKTVRQVMALRFSEIAHAKTNSNMNPIKLCRAGGMGYCSYCGHE